MTNIFKPILFSTEMVQAILAGKKIQTRRIINPQPKEGVITSDDWNEIYWTSKIKIQDNPDRFEITETFKPKYQTGDILWVRETWFKTASPNLNGAYFYKASLESSWVFKWKPSIHMPKETARIFLKVTNVRCERLQEISEGDSISEGVELFDTNRYKDYEDKKSSGVRKARVSFATLWDSINAKKHPWESNPWVWLYDFERIEKPENFIS